jgi:hypothetical protein
VGGSAVGMDVGNDGQLRAVESNAAMRLTTSTFDIMKSDPTLGRAEALRRAMLTPPIRATPIRRCGHRSWWLERAREVIE